MTEKNDKPSNNLNLSEYKRRRLASDITSVHAALVTNMPVKKIPEHIFVNEILPYYCGEATSLELPKLVAAAAGGPFLEFDVVGSAGETLFRAPALLERAMFDFKEAIRGPSVENIFLTAMMLNNRSPKEAENFIENSLTKKGFAKGAAEIYEKTIARRNEILKRYGKTVNGSKGVVSTPGTNHGSTTKPELEYDDN